MATQITQVLATALQSAYAVFQTDQVLTPDQLNSVSRYFDGQTRLARVALTGVGIIAGLQVALQNNLVTLAAGVGVTTDGDLVVRSQAAVYDRYKMYDATNPVYPPLAPGGQLATVYELVVQGVTDAQASSLAQFKSVAPATTPLAGMVAFLLVQTFPQNSAHCTGSNCDNLGAEFQTIVKLLLIDPAATRLLSGSMVAELPGPVTPGEVISRRVVIPVPAGIVTPAQLASVYRTTCTAILADLQPALTSLAASRPDLVPAANATSWNTQLSTWQTAYNASDTGIQYYYDFLKDVVETYNTLRQLLVASGTGAVCCPNPNAFPKHLLLGLVTPGADPAVNRTAYYPSPAALVAAEDLAHANLLARKLGALIQSFKPPVAGASVNDIRITPSRFEDRSLEERAIPYYYQQVAANPVYQSWSYARNRAGLALYNYSYWAQEYGAQGAALSPLAAGLGAWPFWRIEGHLGQKVDAVVSALAGLINQHNLDFVVRTVAAGTDPKFVWRPPGLRYGPLNSIHYMLRQRVVSHLTEVQNFNARFPTQIAADSTQATPAQKQNASTASQTLAANLSTLKSQLNVPFPTYQPGVWKPVMTSAISAAAAFKSNISDVVQPNFASPFDTLITDLHSEWLDWLDQIIAQINQQADTGLLFNNFLADNPGLEHFAGVPRGGTFVLAYDSATNLVVADFMLAYRLPDPIRPLASLPVEIPLVDPAVKPPSLVSLNIIQPVQDYVNSQVANVHKTLTAQFQPNLDLMKNSFLALAAVNPATAAAIPANPGKITDPYLAGEATKIMALQSQLAFLKTQPATAFFTNQINASHTALSAEIQNVASYIDTTKAPVTPGSDGFTALMHANSAISNISDATVKTELKTKLTATATATSHTDLKTFINTGVMTHLQG